jgi:CubicO group peptidase (beta-lactamase class C family)
MMKRWLLTLWFVAGSTCACAAPLKPDDIDQLVTRTMKEFQVPGVAVGIVKDGKLVFAKGYGVRALGDPDPVDADTVFGIASNTKAFTTTALATLVDSGGLGWDDRVIDHLPNFRMYDAWVTREFTVRDLLTHRSGLGLGAGDLLFVTPTDFTGADILKALPHLKPVSSFRAEYAYDNLMYAVAGQLITSVTGKSWEDFVTETILQPLHMDGCAANASRLAPGAKLAAPHVVSEKHLQKITPLEIGAIAPAGAIQCNVTGLGKWIVTQLAHGTAADGTRVFSDKQGAELWTPQTIVPVGGKKAQMTRTHFEAYGLGFYVEDFEGYKRVQHNGGLPGMVTHISMIPELGLGVIVLTNQQEGAVLDAVALSILESYTGGAKHDWLLFEKQHRAELEERIREADAKRAPPQGQSGWKPADPQAYAGVYSDPWRGRATVTRSGDQLRLTFSHTDSLSGVMAPVGTNLFIVRWDDRTLDADAYVRFSTDFGGRITGFTMEAVSDSTDFSFDFQDLSFTREAQAGAGS